MVTVVIHVDKDGAKVGFYDEEGKLRDSADLRSGRRIVLDFRGVNEVRVTPYSFSEGVVVVIKDFKEFKTMEVGGVEEAAGVEGGEVEEPE
ncbi:MAG: hypothetical protein QXX81_07075 [Zestosphaera sp.]